MEKAGQIADKLLTQTGNPSTPRGLESGRTPTAPTSPRSTRLAEGYMQIGQVLARQSQREGAPPEKPVCPVCKGLEVVSTPLTEREAKPNAPYQGYVYSQMIDCPTCSIPNRKIWLSAHCGLEMAQQKPMMVDWQPGDWEDQKPDEREKRIQQRRVAYANVRQASKKKFGIYCYWGDFGSGKSLALATACNELRGQMVETYYTTMAAILDHLRSLYASKTDTSDYWQRLLDIPVLALDEVTRFKETDWAQEKVFTLVNTRYERKKSHLTLFATNDDPRVDLPQGDPLGYLYSRLQEGKLVELRGDFRPIASQDWWDK